MLILLIALGAGVMVYLVLSAPAPTSPAVATPVPASKEAATSFDRKVDTFQKTATAGGKQRVELTLTQQEVSSRIQQALTSREGSEIKDVAVRLKNGGVTLTGVTSLAGMEVPVQADAELLASGGMLGVNITSIKAGGMDLPQPVRDQLTQKAQQAVGLKDLQKIDVGIDVETVQATPDQVRLTGQTR
jgi:hypothetical protein